MPTWKTALLTLVLLAAFPLLWLLNQRLNYRKFLTLDTKFSLNVNTYKASELSSPTEILKYLQKSDPNFTLTLNMDTTDGFDVLYRELTNGKDVVEVYEYQSSRAAAGKLDKIIKNPELSNQVYQYKNLLIFNKTGSENVQKLMGQLQK